MRRGFTLIELLISITIFSILLALAAYSFRFSADVVRKVFMPYPEQAMNYSCLNDALKNIFYFIAEKKDIEGKEKFFVYFFGEKNGVKFITMDKDGPKLCALYLDNNTLKLDKVSVYAKYNNYKNPYFDKDKTKSISLMKNIRDLNISYLVNGVMVHQVNEKIPEMVEINLQQGGEKLTFYFKVESNFEKKKEYTEYFYTLGE